MALKERKVQWNNKIPREIKEEIIRISEAEVRTPAQTITIALKAYIDKYHSKK